MDYSGNRPLFGNRKGASGDPNRFMFWATGAKAPSGSLVTAQSGTNYVMTKLSFGSPEYAINQLRLHFSGFACVESGNSPQETVLPGNATIIDGVWIEANGVVTRLTFGGNTGATIASGANGAWTDTAALENAILPNSLPTIYTLYHCAAGEKQIPSYRVEKHRGERVWGAGDAATLEAMIGSSAPSTAALDTNYGHPTNQPAYYGPDMMLAKGWDGRPVALCVNDSIGDRENDTPQGADARRNKGWMRRWLDSNAGGARRIPHFLMGVPGASSSRELATSATRRWDVLDEAIAFNGGKWPMTCLIDQLGANDYSATYSNFRTSWTELITRIRGRLPNIPVIAIGLMARTTSTDNFLKAANQALGTQQANNRAFDAERAGGMAGLIQGFIDLYGFAYDMLGGKYPDAWTTTLAAQAGTDGTTAYATIRLVDEPRQGDLLRWGTGGAQVANVVDYSGAPGNWLVTLDRMQTAVSATGTPVFAPATSDGVHPRLRDILRIGAAVPQSEKVKLV